MYVAREIFFGLNLLYSLHYFYLKKKLLQILCCSTILE